MPQLQTGYMPLRPHVTSNTDLWDILERKGATQDVMPYSKQSCWLLGEIETEFLSP